MVRGRKIKDHGVLSGSVVSGHLDDWPELAVDYVDGSLDPSTKTAIQTHLQGCAQCAGRLALQQAALATFRQTPLAAAPAELESRVLEQLSSASAKARAARVAARQPSVRRRRVLSPAGPWLPALTGAAAVVGLVIALVVSHSPLGPDGTATTLAAEFSSGAGSAQTLRDAAADLTSTTAAVSLSSGDTSAQSTEAAAVLGAANVAATAAPQPTGGYLVDQAGMVTALSQATAPAYFFFDTSDGASVTAAQADTIASRVSSATGLQLMDQQLSSGVRAFVAYVPREDSTAVVNLLRSISDSLRLTVCLSLQPGAEVTSWAQAMLQDKYSLAELSASPSSPPAKSGWSYTTSTSPPTTVGTGKTPKSTLPDEAGTHVLVVIFMTVAD
jgi:hypothetical protein